jgi:VWFA-related protein
MAARSVGWIALAVSLLAQQPQPATPQPPSFRSGVDIVRLDVSVLDTDRRPVRGLTAGDFAVTVDGTPQPIVAFDAVVVPPREEPTAPWMREVAPDVRDNALGEPRLFVLLMDDATTPAVPSMLTTAVKIAHGIIDQMNASDLAAVVFTMNNSHAQEFTGDRRLLRAAVDHFGAGMPNNPLASKYSSNVLKEVMKALRTRPHGRNAIMLISASPVRSEEFDEMVSEMQQMADLTADLNGIQAATRFASVPIYGFSIAGLVTGRAGDRGR